MKIDRAGLTIWWALRTPQRRGPTGKLDAEEREGGGKGCPLPNQIGVWGALYVYAIQREKYITDYKDFGNFYKTVIVKMTCQSSTDNDF